MLKNLEEILRGSATQGMVHLLSNDFSEAEAAAIHTRVRQDRQYREDLDELLAAFDVLGGLEGDPAVEAIARDYPRMLRERRVRRRLALGVAAGVLLAIGTSLAVFSPWRGPDNSHLQEYFTRIGEQQRIELADGSVVTLNTGGQVVMDYSGPVRRVLLVRGEAYFEVAEDADRPFTVDLGLRSVTAVGTELNIRKHPQHYQVAVIEGAVAIGGWTDEAYASSPSSVNGETVILASQAQQRVEAGWVAEFDLHRNELTAFRPESMERYTGWRSGMIIFQREPLHQVVQELNRYSRTRILIEDTSVMDLSVYTAVRVDDIDTALIGLEKLLPIEVTRHYDRIVIAGSAAN